MCPPNPAATDSLGSLIMSAVVLLSARTGPNVTQMGNRSASVNDQGASTLWKTSYLLNNFVLAVLSVFLPLVLIVCYLAYKLLILKLCNLLDSESFHCIASNRTGTGSNAVPANPRSMTPTPSKSELMEQPCKPTTVARRPSLQFPWSLQSTRT